MLMLSQTWLLPIAVHRVARGKNAWAQAARHVKQVRFHCCIFEEEHCVQCVSVCLCVIHSPFFDPAPAHARTYTHTHTRFAPYRVVSTPPLSAGTYQDDTNHGDTLCIACAEGSFSGAGATGLFPNFHTPVFHSLLHSFTPSLLHPFTPSLLHSFTHTLARTHTLSC